LTPFKPPPNSYYVYLHHDPDTKDLLYVGMGQGSRAYTTRHSTDNVTNYGHRSPEHAARMFDLMQRGYLPHEWTSFPHRNMTKSQALEKERELIKTLKPLYNRKHGVATLKFNLDDIKNILYMWDNNTPQKVIADKMNCSLMSINRIINNKSIRYEEMILGE